VPGSAPLTFRSPHLGVEVTDDAGGTTLTARWRERDGTVGRLDARVALPEGHESVNVVIPWSDTRFQYTSKHQARPATGTLRLGDRASGPRRPGPGAWGVLDVGRGRWPYRTRWNWGSGAGRADDGRVVGLQVGGKWTQGTPSTENGVIVDGRVVKLGDELIWDYDWDAPLRAVAGALPRRVARRDPDPGPRPPRPRSRLGVPAPRCTRCSARGGRRPGTRRATATATASRSRGWSGLRRGVPLPLVTARASGSSR
jgi:hypothetical protein